MPAICSTSSWSPMAASASCTPDGKLNIDDPAVRKAAITALERLTTPFKKGYVPPGAINWGDVDNNNAFFARQIVMTPNATISIAAAQMDKPDQYYKEIITRGIPLGNDGKPVPSVLAISPHHHPEGLEERRRRQGVAARLHPAGEPERLSEGNPRSLSAGDASIVKNDPYWTDPKDPHRPVAVDMGLIKPTVPWWMTYNPAYSAVLSEQIWSAGGSQHHAEEHDPGTGHRGSGQADQAAVRAVSEMTT